ncbi:TPA: 3-deoxy-7-phosphoheptulonate synthase [Aeromonas dhakensis]|nr:3-deoxy-7-phosphoheptulonate synthase [Aeromonas dhakensis]
MLPIKNSLPESKRFVEKFYSPTLSFKAVPTPGDICTILPRSNQTAHLIDGNRNHIARVMSGEDPRWLVVVGPCSIHDPQAGLDYARRLACLAEELSDTFLIAMRVYFEKPRTRGGWKGFINDPHLDNSCRIEEGLVKARHFLLEASSYGLPLAGEALDPLSPLYLADLYSWMAIGARTSESQIHRELASGLNMVVGFKNATDGSLNAAFNAMAFSKQPHSYLGIGPQGQISVVSTPGNPFCHIVLRGGTLPNYSADKIHEIERLHEEHGLRPCLMVDCSHGNSNKNYLHQGKVLTDVVEQIHAGNRSIRAVMLESFVEAGNQPFTQNGATLKYGCSITDPCLDWASTESLLKQARLRLRPLLVQHI